MIATQYNPNSAFSEVNCQIVKAAQGEDVLLCCIYKNPNTNVENEEELFKLIERISDHKAPHKAILGDFNYPKIDWHTWTTSKSMHSGSFRFIEAVRDSYMCQHITEPTRIRVNETPTTLDLILTERENDIYGLDYDSPLGKSDHVCVNFKLAYQHQLTLKPRRIYLYTKGRYEDMKAELSEVDWSYMIHGNQDTTTSYDSLLNMLENVRDKYIPTKWLDGTKHTSTIKLTEDERALVRRKKRAFQRYLETGLESKWLHYTRLRNKVKAVSRRAQKVREMEVAGKAKESPKLFCNYVKRKTIEKTRIPELFIDDRDHSKGMTESDKQKADVLSLFYSSVFTKEISSDLPDLIPRTLDKLSEMRINEELVRKKLQKLNVGKSCGPDDLHPRLLRELASVLCRPLKLLYDACTENCCIPSVWREANITSIYKKGNKSTAGNYRPVSLTCITCKVLESIIRDAIIDFMQTRNLFSKRQYWFMSGRSTTLQLLHVLEEWTQIVDQGGTVHCIFLDFMKAFDSVPHQRLLLKLKADGIDGRLLAWIGRFLLNRRQRVAINGPASAWEDVISGIPQGSVLGPLLFVIYINDLPDAINSQVYMFADDTKIYRPISDSSDSSTLQADLNCLQDWSEKWLIRFHPQKSKSMELGKSREVTEYIMRSSSGPVTLDKVVSERDLGVILDPSLKFRDDISARVNKAKKVMGIIRRSFCHLNVQMFKLLYKALVRPHIEYAAAIWSPRYISDVNIIEGFQRRATRQLPEMKSLSYEERLKKLQLPTLRFRRLRGDIIEVYQMLSGIYDPSLRILFDIVHDSRTRGNCLKIAKQQARTNLRQNSFTFRVVNAWNSLPDCVVTAPSLNSFKNRLDSAWKDHPWRFNFESEIGNYYTSKLRTPQIKTKSDIATPTEEGSGHRGQ